MFRTTAFAAFAVAFAAAPALADEPDGLILPPGFHASVVADGLTGARHLAFGSNGDLYVSTAAPRGQPSTGVIALHLDADHKADQTQHFGTVGGGTAIHTYRGGLYVASATTLFRYPLSHDLVPTGDPETIVDGMPAAGGTHSLAFDNRGNLYISLDGTGNTCVDAAAPKVGLKPCPGLTGRSGVWEFSATKTGQKFPADGTQFATGIRNMGAMDWSPNAGALFGVTHGRDMTNAQFPTIVSAAEDDAIADEMHLIKNGTNMGWPYTYYDSVRKIRLTGPEYGGDGKTPVTDATYDTPVAAFGNTRRAPLDILFYEGTQFPRRYHGGAFIAFHGTSGSKIPGGHGGYEITYVPVDSDGNAGTPEAFAEGFAGPTADDKYSGHAAYRPVGEALGPDGALYVVDSNKGRVWRIVYSG